MTINRKRGHVLGLALAAGTMALGGCAADDGDGLAVTCEGKCDGVGERIKSAYSDMKKVDRGDFATLGVNFVADELNGLIEVFDWEQIRFGDDVTVYALDDVAGDDLTVRSLERLLDGLTAMYGNNSLTTEVASVRRNHLASSGDNFYGEASFEVQPGVSFDWGFDAGLDQEAKVRVGFGRELRAVRFVKVALA